MSSSPLRIGVTPAGYDDIGAVLSQADHAFKVIPLDALSRIDRLRDFDVVFINCANKCRGRGEAETAALRTYVAEGGVLYASDYASDFIAPAFKEYIEFGGFDGQSGTMQVTVVDPGLQITLGKTVQLRFDMSRWRRIAHAPKAQVHLAIDQTPLLVSFDHGAGHVVFTCFHNHKALSSQHEVVLLNYLVLKPLTARAASLAKTTVQMDLSREFIFTLGREEVSTWFEYPAVGGEPLVFALSWQDQATCHIEVHGPDGSIETVSGDQSPLRVNVPLAAGGVWRVRARLAGAAIPKCALHLLVGPPKPDQLIMSSWPSTSTLDVRVGIAPELPIRVLSSEPLVPLTIRRLD